MGRETLKEEKAMPFTSITVGGGFSAYAKINPFASAAASVSPNSLPFGATKSASLKLARTIDTSADDAAGVADNDKAGAETSDAAESGSVSDSPVRSNPKPVFVMPPPLVVPSPKSPRANPFSSPSPAHNPFMTIEEKPSELWNEMANNRLTADEVLKGSAILAGGKKDAPQRKSAAYGGGSTSAPATVTSLQLNGSGSFDYGGSHSNPSSTRAFGAHNNEGFKSSEYVFGQQFASASKSLADSAAADDQEDRAGDDNSGDNEEEEAENVGSSSMKIISLPENVKLVTGEEDDECLLQLRGKLYRYTTKSRPDMTNLTSGFDLMPSQPAPSAGSSAAGSGEKKSIFGSAEAILSGSATDTSKAAAFLESVFSSSASSSTAAPNADKADEVGADTDGSSAKEEQSSLSAAAPSLFADFLSSSVPSTSKVNGNNTSTSSTAAAAASTDANEYEWVEVGVGPLKVLCQKNASADTAADGANQKQTFRMVMRREEKKGGTGECKSLSNAVAICIASSYHRCCLMHHRFMCIFR